jgi:hypothetical protein
MSKLLLIMFHQHKMLLSNTVESYATDGKVFSEILNQLIYRL